MDLSTKFKVERRMLLGYLFLLSGLYYLFNQEFKLFVSEYIGAKRVNYEIAQDSNHQNVVNNVDENREGSNSLSNYKPEILPDLQISRLKGEVFLIDEIGRREKVAQDTKLIRNGSIETMERSYITIAFGEAGENLLTITANSLIKLESLIGAVVTDKPKSMIFLIKGLIQASLKKLKGTEFYVSTPMVALGVRGTEFVMGLNQKLEVLSIVQEGVVELTNNTTKKITLLEKDQAQINYIDGLEFKIKDSASIQKLRNTFFNFDLDSTQIQLFFDKAKNSKPIVEIWNRLTELGEYYSNLLSELEKKKVGYIEMAEKKFEDLEKLNILISEDEKCLKKWGKCILKNENELLKLGRVSTSGTRKINEQSIKDLQSLFKNSKSEVEKIKAMIISADNEIEAFSLKTKNIKDIQDQWTILDDGFSNELHQSLKSFAASENDSKLSELINKI